MKILNKYIAQKERDFIEYNQESVCEYCEDMILECKHSSSTFLCEGCACKEAGEGYLDNYLDSESRFKTFFEIYCDFAWIYKIKLYLCKAIKKININK